MTTGRAIDEKAPNYLKQAIGWSYHAPYAGHDGIQLAIGQVFQKESDHIFLYYRDMLTALSCGLTPEEIILNGISKATDPTSGGRHMSNHFAKPAWNMAQCFVVNRKPYLACRWCSPGHKILRRKSCGNQCSGRIVAL